MVGKASFLQGYLGWGTSGIRKQSPGFTRSTSHLPTHGSLFLETGEHGLLGLWFLGTLQLLLPKITPQGT